MRGESGASALEFAVVAPFLLLLLFGIIEFGFVFWGQLAVTHGAREGARLAAVQNGALFTTDAVVDRVVPVGSTGPLRRSQVSVAPDFSDERSVTVTVSYPWTWMIMPFGEGVTLTSSATMRKE